MGRKKTSQADKAAKMAAAAIERMRRSPFDRLTDGSDAWSQLEAASRAGKRGGRSLDDTDFSKIASQAWQAFQELKPKITAKRTLTGFTQKAFGLHHSTSKELSVVMLPPGESASKRGIRKNIRSYYQLIKQMADDSGVSRSRLADTILRGTKLHPLAQVNAGTLSDLETVDTMLRTIVDKLDEEFGLLNLYQQTAVAKAEAIRAGSRNNWPLLNLELDAHSDDDIQSYREILDAAMDPQQAFWIVPNSFGDATHAYLRDGIMRLVRNDTFFYIPHTLLGQLLIWDLPDRRDDPVAFDLALAKEIVAVRSKHHYIDTDLVPRDDWDAVANCPNGQTDPMESNALQYHFWLIAYPDPTGQKLLPCLYMPCAEEGEPYLFPICVETLLMLQRTYWISGTECKPAFDRLVELLTEQTQNGESVIVAGLRRTAPWLHFNPILKEAAKKADAHAKLNDAFRALVGSPATTLTGITKNEKEKA